LSIQLRQDIVDDLIDLGISYPAVGRYPDVTLGATDEDLPVHAIMGERMARMAQTIPELSHAEPALGRQGFQGQIRVKRDADDDRLDPPILFGCHR
jgi:hypothetical protein